MTTFRYLSSVISIICLLLVLKQSIFKSAGNRSCIPLLDASEQPSSPPPSSLPTRRLPSLLLLSGRCTLGTCNGGCSPR